MAKPAKVDYDDENDILYLFTGEKASDSLEIDNFVIDFSSDNKIVGVEIMNATEMLSKLSQIIIPKDSLSRIESAAMNIYHGRELLYILLAIRLPINNRIEEIRIPVPAPAAISI